MFVLAWRNTCSVSLRATCRDGGKKQQSESLIIGKMPLSECVLYCLAIACVSALHIIDSTPDLYASPRILALSPWLFLSPLPSTTSTPRTHLAHLLTPRHMRLVLYTWVVLECDLDLLLVSQPSKQPSLLPPTATERTPACRHVLASLSQISTLLFIPSNWWTWRVLRWLAELLVCPGN